MDAHGAVSFEMILLSTQDGIKLDGFELFLVGRLENSLGEWSNYFSK